MLKFIIPSLIGISLFIFPINYNGEITIAIAILSKLVLNILTPFADSLLFGLIMLSAIITVATAFIKPKRIMNNPYLKTLFCPSWVWFTVRIISTIFISMILFQVGPEIIWNNDNGRFVVASLLPTLLSVFLLAGLLLPLLLNFGLLEFIGVMLTKVMRPIFKLPGRSSIDCVASWLGDGAIGILLTNKQFEQGFYTQREAAIIGTTFSAVSITFSLIVIETVGLGHMFVPFYLTVSVTGFIVAIITPRIPPLSRKKDIYYQNKKTANIETIPQEYNLFSWGLKHALNRAEQNKSALDFFKSGMQNVLDMWLGVIPVVLTLGTIALILANNTSVFEWLGTPFVPLLELLQIPEASAASKTILVGFADMFVPALIAAKEITSPLTKFVIAALSVTQLIYMAEVGALLLGSKIPVSFLDLVIIFLQRTLISLPIIALIAHWLF